MAAGRKNREANIWTARFIPLFLLGIIGYASWVITELVCVDYLLQPSPSLLQPPQTGAAIAILTIYYVLLLILLTCFGRLIHTIITNPGIIPRGPQWYVEQERKSGKKKKHIHLQKEESLEADSTHGDHVYQSKRFAVPDDISFKVEDFWKKDVFTCNHDGRPRFCSTCFNWKPDRSHHCSELDRCVLKMDHFCPWVGGIVSETSFKFFIQFTFWGALYTLHTLIVIAYFFAERRQRENFLDVHWILIIAISALFFIFGAGMCGSSLQFAFENTSTIENFTKRSQVWYLAIYVPEYTLQKILASQRNDLRLITYPRPPSEQLQMFQNAGVEPGSTFPPHPAARPSSHTQTDPNTPLPSHPQSDFTPPPTTRTFAILETKPGASPFDLGYSRNFMEVMGYNILDWVLPIHQSPVTNHDHPESMYRMGRVVYRLRRDAGILDENEDERRRHSSHRKRRRRRRGTKSGANKESREDEPESTSTTAPTSNPTAQAPSSVVQGH